jgi:hypothetical protein
LSVLINQYLNLVAMPAVARDTGVMFAFLGKPLQQHQAPVDGLQFERQEKITGDQAQIRLLGSLKAVAKVANYTGELAARSVTTNNTSMGAIKFPMTHYADAEDIPSSEIKQFQGDEAKTLAWVQKDLAQRVNESINDTLANDLSNSTPAIPADNTLGTLSAAIDDGNTTATYGLDRSDAANSWFRSYVDSTAGPATLERVRMCKAKIREARGVADLLTAPTAIWVKLAGAVEAYTQVNYDSRWSQFGGEWVKYAGMVLVQDHRMSSTSLYVMTSAAWTVVQNDIYPFQVGEMMRNPGVNAGWLLPYEFYLGIFCRHCGQQAKLTNLTG